MAALLLFYRCNPSLWFTQLLVRLEVLLTMEVEVKEVLVLLVEVTDLTWGGLAQKYPGYPGDPFINGLKVMRKLMRSHWSFGAPSNPPILNKDMFLLSYIFRTKNGSKWF